MVFWYLGLLLVAAVTVVRCEVVGAVRLGTAVAVLVLSSHAGFVAAVWLSYIGGV
jgi:hypothetical protein